MKTYNTIIGFYLFLNLLFFYFIGLEVLHGHITFQFYADSKVYEEIALFRHHYGALTEVNHNTFGPVFLLQILGPRNYWAIYLFNIVLFLISIYLLTSTKGINGKVLVLLIMIQPITFSSLMTINKEMICLLCVSLIIYNHERKNKVICIILLLLTYIARWQFTLFYLIYLFIFFKGNILRNKRLLTIIGLLLSITFALFSLRNTFLSSVFDIYDLKVSTSNAHGAGTFRLIMSIQDKIGYIFAFIPKVLINLTGLIANYKLFFDFSFAYNNTVMFSQTVVYIFLLFLGFKKKIYKLEYTYFYIFIIYCCIFAISPVFSPRYFYAGMLFFCYEISRHYNRRPSLKNYKNTDIISTNFLMK